jgi:hypothetical protein
MNSLNSGQTRSAKGANPDMRSGASKPEEERMANLEQQKYASMVRMLQTAYPRHWELHLRNLGVTPSDSRPPADLDRIVERVFWMVRQATIKNPAAWMAFDMDRAEAASASVQPEAASKVVARQNPVELEPVKIGTDLAKTSGRLPPASQTLSKEPAARIPGNIARVMAASASVEPVPKAAFPVGVRRNKPVSFRKGPVKTTNELLVEAETAIVIDRLLSQAKQAIQAGRRQEAAAAMYIAYEKYGATQQQIAAAVGKCQTWVSRMIRWRREGLKETPFGPASRDAREARRIERVMPRKQPRGVVRLWMRTRSTPNAGFCAAEMRLRSAYDLESCRNSEAAP